MHDSDSPRPGTVNDFIAWLRTREAHPIFSSLMARLLGGDPSEGGAERLLDPPSIRSLVKRRLWLERFRLIWNTG